MSDVLHRSLTTSPSHTQSLRRSSLQQSQPSQPCVKWELGFSIGATIQFCFVTNSCQTFDSNGQTRSFGPPLSPLHRGMSGLPQSGPPCHCWAITNGLWYHCFLFPLTILFVSLSSHFCQLWSINSYTFVRIFVFNFLLSLQLFHCF
jgi:hypothetical protein